MRAVRSTSEYSRCLFELSAALHTYWSVDKEVSVKSKKACSALTIGELVILVVVVIVFIALLPPAISLVRKRSSRINDVSEGKRVAAALTVSLNKQA